MKKNYIFTLILACIINIQAQVPQIERDALITFYTETSVVPWVTSTNWNTATPVSTWFGITTQVIAGVEHVTEINLPENNIPAPSSLPSEIGNLSELRKLNIRRSYQMYSVSPTIPIEIGNLTNLEYIDLQNYGLTGSIPVEIGNLTNLYWLNIGSNNLLGIIPTVLTTLPNLYVLEISRNKFSGTLPNFSSLSNLTYLWMFSNQFQFADFENEFTAYQTNIGAGFVYSPQAKIDTASSLAVSVGNLTVLNAYASGSQNNYQWFKDGVQLAGETNNTLTVTVNSMADYGVYTYHATSAIVTGLTLESRTKTIGASPTSNTDYAALVALYNSTNGSSWNRNDNWNDITKPIETWEGLVFNTNNRVIQINLGSNNLTGVLPVEIGNFTELEYLLLWGNHITGTIPVEIGNLSNLKILDLAPNNFSGSIPTEIGNLTNLETLWLNQNGLSGTIPMSFQNLTNLTELYLLGSVGPSSGFSSSNFSGSFPDLTALPLQTLQIQNNYFTFNDIANEFNTYVANIPNFVFSPQYTTDNPEIMMPGFGDNIVLTITDTVNRNATTNSTTAQNTYQWFKDQVAISGATSTSYTLSNVQAIDNGTYHAEIYNTDYPNMVIRRTNIIVNVAGTSAINDYNLNEVVVYPNPTSDFIGITTNDNFVINKIIIYNSLGKIVKTSKQDKLDVKNLENGLYFITVIDINGKMTQKKFIKI